MSSLKRQERPLQISTFVSFWGTPSPSEWVADIINRSPPVEAGVVNSRSPRSRRKLEADDFCPAAHQTGGHVASNGRWRRGERDFDSGNNQWEWPWKWNPESWENHSHLRAVPGLASVLVIKYVVGLNGFLVKSSNAPFHGHDINHECYQPRKGIYMEHAYTKIVLVKLPPVFSNEV